MAIKGSVTINFSAIGIYSIEPVLGIVDRNVQVLQWTLVAPEGVTFAKEGIILSPEPLPLGFSPWPQDAELMREDDWQYRCEVNAKINKGDPPQRYRYDIVINVGGVEQRVTLVDAATGQEVIDPPVENQPEP